MNKLASLAEISNEKEKKKQNNITNLVNKERDAEIFHPTKKDDDEGK